MLLTMIIPTRNRQQLAKRAVRWALAAGHEDLQIIVLDNSDDSELSVADFGGDSRVEIAAASTTLAMNANWERGLAIARGEYVAYISDKDLVLPGSLSQLITVAVSQNLPGIIAYRKAWFDEPTATLIHYRPTGLVTRQNTRDFLRAWYAVPRHIHSMPSIYGGFVHRQLLNDACSSSKPFFVGNSPDVASAAVLCGHTEHYVQWDCHAVVAHSGVWSTGAPALKEGVYSAAARRFFTEYQRPFHVELGLPGVLSTAVAEVLLLAQEKHPHQLGEYSIDWDLFLGHLRDQVEALELPKSVKAAEWARIYGPASTAPRDAVSRYRYRRLATLIRRAYYQHLSRFVAPVKDVLTGRDRRALQTAKTAPPWDDIHYSARTHAATVDEAVDVTLRMNLLGTHVRTSG